MKLLTSCLTLLILVNFAGCKKGHDAVGDAARTESASAVTGWKEISTSGIALSFPSGWNAMDLAKESFDQGSAKAFGNDPKFAAVVDQAKALAKQGLCKLFVFDMSTADAGFATNCNVIIQDMPGNLTIEQVAEVNKQQIESIVATGTKPQLEYVSLKSGKAALIRSEIKTPNPSIPLLVTLTYLSVKGRKMAVITFTMPKSDESGVRKIADQAMSTFRFTE